MINNHNDPSQFPRCSLTFVCTKMLYSTEVFTSVLYFVFYRHRGGALRNAAIRLSVPADTGMQHLAPRPAEPQLPCRPLELRGLRICLCTDLYLSQSAGGILSRCTIPCFYHFGFLLSWERKRSTFSLMTSLTTSL